MGLNLNLKVSDGGIRRFAGSKASSARGVFSASDLHKKIKDNPGFRLKGDTLVAGFDDGVIDAALAALRCGSDSVTVVLPQQRNEASELIAKASEALGANASVACGWGQPSIDVHTDGRVSGATFQRCTRAFDDGGEFNPLFDEGSTMARYCDNLVIV